MTAPMSQDLRQRIVRAVAQGSSARQARFEVSPSAAVKLMQRLRQTGNTRTRKDRRLPPSSA
jgi:transposase